MTEPPSTDDWFTLAELDGRLAGLVWVERAMAELLDHWSITESSDQVAISFATAAGHHRWHADVLGSCRIAETTPHLDPPPVAPPSPGWRDAVETLTSANDPDRTALRLSALVRHLDPWLVRETNALLACSRPVADAALMRWLRFVEADHHDDGSGFAALFDRRANLVELRDHAVLASIDLTMSPRAVRSLD